MLVFPVYDAEETGYDEGGTATPSPGIISRSDSVMSIRHNIIMFAHLSFSQPAIIRLGSFCSAAAAVCGFFWLVNETPADVAMMVRAPASHVGAAMALLATLQDADVLPPEGTPDANRIVKSVIQCQSLFMNSSDPNVRAFFDRALQNKLNVHAAEAGRRFREEGWTSETLETLSESYVALSDGERAQLAGGFHTYNLVPDDFLQLSELFLRARTILQQRGQDIHQIYARRRQEMPGQRLPRSPESPTSPS
jgi:hypothetical protein